MKCTRCNGCGKIHETCPRCFGSGEMEDQQPFICPVTNAQGVRCVHGKGHEGDHEFEDDFVIPAG